VPKNQLKNYVLVDAVSTAAGFSSDPIDVEFLDNIGFNVDWTGTTTGTITIEASNTTVSGSFKALTFDPVLAQPSGSASGYLISVNQTPWSFIRFSYARTSGTGTMTVSVAAKAV
jgi:hypothetical protein